VNLIHIGLPKTASTTLQDRLFSKQDRFAYLGRFQNGYLNQTTKELLERLTFEDSLEYDQSIMNALLQRARSEMRISSRPILVSAESLSVEGRADRRLIAERLHELFAPAKILIVLRSQPAMLQSMYLNDLRGSGQGILSFEAWLERVYGGIRYTETHRVGLNYEPLVRTYEGLFGRENVTVLPFEFIKDEDAIFFDRLSELLQMEREEVQRRLEMAENQRMSRRHMMALRIQHYLPSGTNLALLGRRLLPRPIYEPVRNFVAGGARIGSPELPTRWRERVAAICAVGNSRIAARLNLPLAALGYPVAS
jgi:hypothetical protein